MHTQCPNSKTTKNIHLAECYITEMCKNNNNTKGVKKPTTITNVWCYCASYLVPEK